MVCKTTMKRFDSVRHLERNSGFEFLFFRAGLGKAAVRLHIWPLVFPAVFFVLDLIWLSACFFVFQVFRIMIFLIL